MPTTFQGLLLTAKGEVKQLKLSVAGTEITSDDIQKALKKKTEAEYLGEYPYKSKHLHLFGYQKGKAGTENKHELPPPHDGMLLFGDILVVTTTSADSYSNPIPFTMEDYEAFYTSAFGGFEDLDEEEEEIEESEEEIEDDKGEKEEEAEVEAEVEEEEEEEEAEVEEAEEGEEDVGPQDVEEAIDLGDQPARSTRTRSRRKKGADTSKNLATSTKITSNFLEGYKKSTEQLRPDAGTPETSYQHFPKRTEVIAKIKEYFTVILYHFFFDS
jgi:hypothetical protein